jgi:rSAM/selenodomain-associated transferase 1
MSATLGLFAKLPQPGHAKTRLAQATSPQWAARVAEAFLRDSVRRLGTIVARRMLLFAPPEAASYFNNLARPAFEARAQVGGDLGQRLAVFFSAALAEGADRVLAIGTDSPTLPLPLIPRALEQLQDADVVLGPATDGGYYLLGCARRLPPLFDGITWSTTEVTSATVAHVRRAGLRLALLPPWYDVDTLDDWRMLRGHVEAMRCAGIDPEVPHTEALFGQPW